MGTYKSGMVAIGLLVASNVAVAGNWVRSEGEKAIGANLSYATANQFWNQNRVLGPFACGTHDNTGLGLNAEYGLSYHYTLIAQAGLHKIACGPNSASGLGDVAVGIRGRLDALSNGKAWELKLIVPGGYDAAAPIRLGYGEVGLEAGAYFGPPFDAYDEDPYKPGYFPKLDSYWEYCGFTRVWNGAPATEIAGHVKWKHAISDTWKIGPALNVHWTFGKGDRQFPNLFGNRFAYTRSVVVGVELSTLIGERTSFHITPQATVWGENAAKSVGVSVGVSKAFK
jgi:hypothetical protein